MLLRDESLAPSYDSSNDSSSDYFTEKDPKEDPKEDPEDESEPVDEKIEILEYEPEVEGDGKQEDSSVIEDFPERKEFFRRFGNKKRKRNVIRSRPFRPRTWLGIDGSKVKSIPMRLRIELRRLT
ncbi:hypothetical protein FNV43_RR17003 [Rhamnella rubrinervis]|uniref:Uncharacterized protein n=1 Tax=Rhamnella rubrinervis TaxID=2594499 RepID=A0A8K0GZU2_9ROSA|nr:hypothetical protein FNV43_RR17003 [Rhamnella rubrinervis]